MKEKEKNVIIVILIVFIIILGYMNLRQHYAIKGHEDALRDIRIEQQQNDTDN